MTLQHQAEAGSPLAALLYAETLLSEGNWAGAILWLETAATRGNPDAFTRLSAIYREGTIIPKDMKKADAYLAKAIEAENQDLT